MKVLMVTPTYYPTIGGIETFIETIAKRLNERNVSTDIMVLSRTAKGNALWAGGVCNTEAGKVIRVPTSEVPELKFFRKTITPFKAYLQTQFIPKPNCLRLMKDYDILHFHDENDLSLFMFSSFIRRSKIFHYHILSISLPHLRQKERFLCRYVLKKDVVYHLVNSEYSKNLLKTIGIDSERILVIPNAIDLNIYAPKLTVASESRTDGETRKILYISRLSFEKLDSVVNLINSATKLYEHIPKLRILIVGEGPYFDYIRELSEKVNKKLNDRVIVLLGGIAESEKPKLINSADIVVGVSRVALEAMASGTPVIIAGDKFIEEKSEAFFGGIVTEENANELKFYNFCYKRNSEIVTPNKIASAALKLLTNEKYRQQVAVFGRKFVEKEYNANGIAEQLDRIYQTIKK